MKPPKQHTGRIALIGSFIVLLLALIGMAAISRGTPGSIAVVQTNYDFGNVPIDGGVVTTSFPVTIEGSVRITELSTT